jgi:hypothetical protein
MAVARTELVGLSTDRYSCPIAGPRKSAAAANGTRSTLATITFFAEQLTSPTLMRRCLLPGRRQSVHVLSTCSRTLGNHFGAEDVVDSDLGKGGAFRPLSPVRPLRCWCVYPFPPSPRYSPVVERSTVD